ncbi:MAG: hypothetical protein ACK4KW_03285 [Gemmobacter sp.]
MGAASVQQMADRVAQLMEDRLRIRGNGLAEKLRRGGRALPRRVRREAEYLAEVAALARHPKVQTMLDDTRIAEAYDTCIRHLNEIGAFDRFMGRLLGVTGSILFGLLVTAGLFVAVLVWRGFL